jgi:acyl dehydratase
MSDVENFDIGVAEAMAWIDKPRFEVTGEFDVERGYIWTSVASVQNGNPVYWDDEVAQQITGGVIAPPTLMSAWFRPHHWVPNRDKVPLPWSTHFWLKETLQVPEAIATDSEVVFGSPIRIGDRISTYEVLRSLGDLKTTKLGKGRFWKIDAVCTNQKGEWVGTETMTGFGYRNLQTLNKQLEGG